jgi:chaperonin GroEL
MAKPIVRVGVEAISEMVTALSSISAAVGSTLGPGGRPFAIDRMDITGRIAPTFTKDGLTVLRSLGFDSPAWEAVLAFCRQAASHSVISSGDGTTSTIVLAAEIAKQVIASQHKWPQAFARQLEREANEAIEAIKTEVVTGDDIVRSVALTSANGDQELADVVLQSVEKSSAFGAIVVEKNPAARERYRVLTQDGYCHCHGYDYNNTMAWSADPRAASNEAIEWENPLVAIVNGNLTVAHQIDPILAAWNEVLKSGEMRKLIVVAYDISDEVINKLLVVNRTMAKAGANIFVVKPRLSAEINSGLQALRDIAAFCGVSDEHIIDGGNYKTIDVGFLGFCAKIKITPTTSVFMGRSTKHWVDMRIHQNLKIAEEARCQADRELTLRRNAQLTEGLVKVEVGCGLLPDLQERADRFDDASKAAQACMRSGALPGCGSSLIRAAQLAKSSTALRIAFSAIHDSIMKNYGAEPLTSFRAGQCVKLSETGETKGKAIELGILDSAETVYAVIKNGVGLGVKIAILGGYSLRQTIGQISDEA